MKLNEMVLRVGLAVAVGLVATTQGFATADSSDERRAVFATVNGEPILVASYETALRVAGRKRFYHGRAPEAELEAFRKEVAERLIVERVMYQEAVRRGVKPDSDWVEAEYAKIEQRYSASPQWSESGGELHQQIREGLVQRNLIAQMDQSYRTVEQPSRDEVRAYYEGHQDKFTSPEQIKVSTILLKVEPWQSSEVWEERTEQAEALLAELMRGAAFDEYARKYPPEKAEQLGYLHRGMLGQTAQDAIDGLQPGEITGVVTLLEGVAIFRLDDRVEARLNPLDKVYERASELLVRERSESAYKARMDALRKGARVEFTDPQYYRTATVATLQDSIHGAPSGAKKE